MQTFVGESGRMGVAGGVRAGAALQAFAREGRA